MDTQILEWVTQQAEDWWTSQRSHTYVWGKGHWNVIGHSGRERILPTLLDEWKDIRMVHFNLRSFVVLPYGIYIQYACTINLNFDTMIVIRCWVLFR